MKAINYLHGSARAVLFSSVLWIAAGWDTTNSDAGAAAGSEYSEQPRSDEKDMKSLHLLDSLLEKDDYAVLWLNSPQGQLSGKLAKRLWNKGVFRICTDGAANFIMKFVRDENILKPDLISGDFDSISAEAKNYFNSQNVRLVETSDQDYTDMCKALRIIADGIKEEKLNVSKVIVLGGLFGRFDHVLSSVHSLLRFQMLCDSCEIIIVDGVNLVTVLSEGSTNIEIADRHLLSGKCGVIPFVQRETIVTSSGLKWNLNKTELAFGKLISTSNELVDSTVSLSSTAPLIFTVELSETALS